ncbi:MAG: hypothetical protein AB8B63_17965 [Granulosicoccus sp.]
MAAPPLTHHEIIKHAAPLTRRGMKVNLAASHRNDRYIEFDPVPSTADRNTSLSYALQVGVRNVSQVTRVIAHANGLISTLTAIVADTDAALEAFEKIPHRRQLFIHDAKQIAMSYTLEAQDDAEVPTGVLQLRYVCARVHGLELRVDVSTGRAMPADVRLLLNGVPCDYLRETLADGEDSPLIHRAGRRLIAQATQHGYARSGDTSVSPLEKSTESDPAEVTGTFAEPIAIKKLPDDILAILGPQWRPLVYQGDHWKGVLRQLGSGTKRTERAENFVKSAMDHLANTLSTPPSRYHEKFGKARWLVFLRRLKPIMFLIGILALMPLSWLFVSEGGMQMHPLALGLTPLLMVSVIALTAREIPIMEIPPRPSGLPSDFWSAAQGNQ